MKASKPKLNYFLKQLSYPYESTIKLNNFYKKYFANFKKKIILDLGCGIGEFFFYLKEYNKKFFYNNNFYGVDVDKKNISLANKIKKKKQLKNVFFLRKNFFDKINLKKKIDICFCLQTILCFEDYRPFFKIFSSIKPKYIVISSLFSSENLDCIAKINIKKNKFYNSRNEKTFFYSTFSLSNFISYSKKKGYLLLDQKKFRITKSLKSVNPNQLGTYTVRYKKENLQLSGPLVLNWYFLIFKKK